MLASPDSAIDLPLKISIWEDAQSKVWVSYNSPFHLQERRGLPLALMQNVAVIETLAAKSVDSRHSSRLGQKVFRRLKFNHPIRGVHTTSAKKLRTNR